MVSVLDLNSKIVDLCLILPLNFLEPETHESQCRLGTDTEAVLCLGRRRKSKHSFAG